MPQPTVKDRRHGSYGILLSTRLHANQQGSVCVFGKVACYAAGRSMGSRVPCSFNVAHPQYRSTPLASASVDSWS
jgi:hypothetical protein